MLSREKADLAAASGEEMGSGCDSDGTEAGAGFVAPLAAFLFLLLLLFMFSFLLLLLLLLFFFVLPSDEHRISDGIARVSLSTRNTNPSSSSTAIIKSIFCGSVPSSSSVDTASCNVSTRAYPSLDPLASSSTMPRISKTLPMIVWQNHGGSTMTFSLSP